jgi:hypothetical protein
VTTPSTTPSVKPPLGKVILRRTAIAVALLLLMLVPSAVLFAITKQPAATYASMGVLIGTFALLAGGRRIAIITAVVVSLLAPLAIVSGLSPFTGAALMAIMTLAVGRLSIFGLNRATMLVPIFLAWPILTPVPWIPSGDLDRVNELLTKHGLSLAQALNDLHSNAGSASSSSSGASSTVTTFMQNQRFDNTYLTWVAFFFFVGTIIPVIVIPLLMRKMKKPELDAHSRSEAIPYTIIITVLTAAATYYCLDHPKMVGGAFIIATILVLTQVGNDIAWKITIERVAGTFAGLFLLLGITTVVGAASYTSVFGIPMPMKYYVIGVVLGAFAIIAKFSPRQWIYYIFITPTAALLNAFTTSQATSFGDQRVIDNAVGAALVIIATLVTLAAGRIMKGRITIAPPMDLSDASPA